MRGIALKKVETTENLKKDMMLRVYKKGYGYAKMQVYTIDSLFLATQVQADFFDDIFIGDKLNCYVWVDNVASYKFDLVVSAKMESEKHLLFFRHCHRLDETKGKECLVADVSIPISFYFLNRGNLQQRVSSEVVIEHNAKIIKLSDREAILMTDEDVVENELVKGHFEYKGERMELTGRINSTGVKNDEYRVEFVGMSDKDRCTLLDYVFGEFKE